MASSGNLQTPQLHGCAPSATFPVQARSFGMRVAPSDAEDRVGARNGSGPGRPTREYGKRALAGNFGEGCVVQDECPSLCNAKQGGARYGEGLL